MQPIHPVILSGGMGSRLWPLSRVQQPKQFQPIDGADGPTFHHAAPAWGPASKPAADSAPAQATACARQLPTPVEPPSGGGTVWVGIIVGCPAILRRRLRRWPAMPRAPVRR